MYHNRTGRSLCKDGACGPRVGVDRLDGGGPAALARELDLRSTAYQNNTCYDTLC
jgi:hypothetical protein